MTELINLHTKFRHILYKDRNHTYINDLLGIPLISVTTLIKQYITPFNSDYWSVKKAEERGISVQEILDEWDITRALGAGSGTILHLYLENKWLRKEADIDYKTIVGREVPEEKYLEFLEILKKTMWMADRFYEEHSHIIPISLELVLGNEVVAGTCDFLGYDVLKNHYVLYDYKTDKKLEMTNKWNKKFKRPINNLEECEFNKYSLQLGIYEILLNEVGIFPKEKCVIWFNKDNENYLKYNVKNVRAECTRILELL